MSRAGVGYLYNVMDAAYDAHAIYEASTTVGRTAFFLTSQ